MEKTKKGLDQEMDLNFEDALEDYLKSDFGDLDEGTIVPGTIVKIGKDHVLVDVNFKSEGQIAVSEFPTPTADHRGVGDTVTFNQ
jgi:small subunit ribosomal protein S1